MFEILADTAREFTEHLARLPDNFIEATIRNAECSKSAAFCWFADLLSRERIRRLQAPDTAPEPIAIPFHLDYQQLAELQSNLASHAQQMGREFVTLPEDHPRRAPLWQTGRLCAILAVIISNWMEIIESRNRDSN